MIILFELNGVQSDAPATGKAGFRGFGGRTAKPVHRKHPMRPTSRFSEKKPTPEGPGPPNLYGVIRSDLQVRFDLNTLNLSI